MHRYRIQNNPTFDGLLSKEDLYLLVERGSIGRGDFCEDTRTGSAHKIGELISGMSPPAPGHPGMTITRPAYQEIRADGIVADDEDIVDDGEENEEEDDGHDYTASGERIHYRRHPSWLSYWKPLFLFVLLGIAAGLGFQFGGHYLLLGITLASATMTAIAILRFSCDYIVTDERAEMVWGIFGRSSKEVRICDIRAIDVHESGLLGMLGIGSVDFSSSANAGVEVTFHHIRGAHRVKEIVRQLQKATSAE